MAPSRMNNDGTLHHADPDTTEHVMPGQAVMGTPSGPKLVNASAAASDLVIIPGGQRPRSFVHQVEEGHVIDGSEGKLRKFTASGEFLEDFGPHVRSGVAAVATSGSDGEPFMPDHVVLPDSTPQGAPAPTQAPDARPDG